MVINIWFTLCGTSCLGFAWCTWYGWFIK